MKNLEPFSTQLQSCPEISGLQLLHFPPVSDLSNDVRILSSEKDGRRDTLIYLESRFFKAWSLWLHTWWIQNWCPMPSGLRYEYHPRQWPLPNTSGRFTCELISLRRGGFCFSGLLTTGRSGYVFGTWKRNSIFKSSLSTSMRESGAYTMSCWHREVPCLLKHLHVFLSRSRVVRCYVYHGARPVHLLLSSFSVAVIFFTPHGLAGLDPQKHGKNGGDCLNKNHFEYSTAMAVLESYKNLNAFPISILFVP